MLRASRFVSRLNSYPVRFFSNVRAGVHASQQASLSDSLIQVDEKDRVLGAIPKLESHLADAINGGIIHRAFSVFLFSRDSHALLVQKRSSSKIVFPREWANTCCSHPLFTEAEMANVNGNEIGIKRAAVKRVNAELGIGTLVDSSFSFKEKILYRQMSPGGVFGESECDYILVGQFDPADPVQPNPDEVEEYRWVAPGPAGARTQNLVSFLNEERNKGFPPTPWFDLMVREPDCLEKWWQGLMSDSELFMRSENTRAGEIRNFLQ